MQSFPVFPQGRVGSFSRYVSNRIPESDGIRKIPSTYTEESRSAYDFV